MCKIIIYISVFTVLIVGCNPTPKLKETVLSVQEIKEIGELVTAEYYGEVISGHRLLVNMETEAVFLNAIKIVRNKIASKRKEINDEYNLLILDRKKSIRRLETKKRVLFRKSRIAEINNEINRLEKKRDKKLRHSAKKINSANFSSALKLLGKITDIKRNKRLIELILKEENDTKLYEKYKTNIAKYTSEKNREELVYIGRGSIKAGYDLKNIDNENIFFSESRDTMYIINFDPFITDLDINPYFYFPSEDSIDSPSGRTKEDPLFGFEVIYSNKENKFSMEKVNRIKSDCKHKLRQEALQRNIFEHAHKNAEEALGGFLGMMLTDKKTHIKKLIISPSKYFYYKSNYLFDLEIDSTEYEEIAEIIIEDINTLDSISFKLQTHEYQLKLLDSFIKDLYTQTKGNSNYEKWDQLYGYYIANTELFKITNYSSYQSEFLKDTIIDATEYNEISEILNKGLIPVDSISFKHQPHAYQFKLLDTFIMDLHAQTKGSSNYEKWDSLYSDFNRKKEDLINKKNH